MENNPDYYPPVSFYFSVVVDGETMGFQEVSGISQELGFEEVTEGGENRFKHRLPTGAKYQNLVLKRGVIIADSMLAKWCIGTISNGFTTPVSTKNITVNLLDEKVPDCIVGSLSKYDSGWNSIPIDTCGH